MEALVLILKSAYLVLNQYYFDIFPSYIFATFYDLLDLADFCTTALR